jgi:hypothetical protein
VTKKRPPRARTELRKLERGRHKLALAQRKLLLLEPGGSPERPLEVDSAAVIERRAESFTCPDSSQPLRAIEHESLEHAGELLRAVALACRGCGAPLRLYFRIRRAHLN